MKKKKTVVPTDDEQTIEDAKISIKKETVPSELQLTTPITNREIRTRTFSSTRTFAENFSINTDRKFLVEPTPKTSLWKERETKDP